MKMTLPHIPARIGSILRSRPAWRMGFAIDLVIVFVIVFSGALLLGNAVSKSRPITDNLQNAETKKPTSLYWSIGAESTATNHGATQTANASSPDEELSGPDEDGETYTVQAVLAAKHQVVIASGIDAKISKFNLESGDLFRKGDVLVEYDCSIDYGRLNEAKSRLRVTEQQLEAYQKLVTLESASQMELTIAQENNEQNKAIVEQIEGRIKACRHIAPWNGRVTRKMASENEYVQTGRVLMEISSREPLRAEFLVPSVWLRWLNVGTPLRITINETGQDYDAKIVTIFGEVDPVSQSVQVVAEMEAYHQELLPGMSGRATFSKSMAAKDDGNGFLGLILSPQGAEDTP